MIANFRLWVSKLFPEKAKWALILTYLPGIVNFAMRLFQGISLPLHKDSEFQKVYASVKPRILLDQKRAHILYSFAKQCMSIPGEYAELGVYRGGGSEIMMRGCDGKKHLYMFDTFEGLPEPSQFDTYWKTGDLGGISLEEIRNRFSTYDTEFVVGLFPGTTSQIPDDLKFAFVHVDTDLYQGTADACAYFYPRLSPGAILLFDDYAFMSCIGVRKAADDFFADKPEELMVVPSGQAFIIKL